MWFCIFHTLQPTVPRVWREKWYGREGRADLALRTDGFGKYAVACLETGGSHGRGVASLGVQMSEVRSLATHVRLDSHRGSQRVAD